jgi:hypothetical protein
METSLIVTSSAASMRRALEAIACAAVAFGLSGCANSGTMTPSAQAPAARIAPTSSSGFTFYTVDYPNQSPNRVTGIADNQEIVGVYGDGGSQNYYHSYTSSAGSKHTYTQFQNDDYPNAPSTYMASIIVAPKGNGVIQSGYAIVPYTLQGTWGLFNNKGLWTLIQKHAGEGKCHMMELFGTNSSYYSVGFYWHDDSPPSGNCSKHTQYVTELRPGEGFHDFTGVSGANPTASGVNSAGWLVGSTDNSGKGPSQGWTKGVCKGCRGGQGAIRYWNYNLDSHRSTLMNAVNDSAVVVGTYEDANDNWHGFMATQLFNLSGSPTWKTVDEPSGIGTNTVISDIDNNGDICGWYTGSDGKTHGFVGIYNK